MHVICGHYTATFQRLVTSKAPIGTALIVTSRIGRSLRTTHRGSTTQRRTPQHPHDPFPHGPGHRLSLPWLSCSRTRREVSRHHLQQPEQRVNLGCDHVERRIRPLQAPQGFGWVPECCRHLPCKSWVTGTHGDPLGLGSPHLYEGRRAYSSTNASLLPGRADPNMARRSEIPEVESSTAPTGVRNMAARST